jgi:probable HAF family extracellular repeat protein
LPPDRVPPAPRPSRRQFLLWLGGVAALAVALLLPSCDGSGSHSPGSGRATCTVQWLDRSRLIPLAANSVKVVLSRGETVIAERVLARPPDGSASSATFENLPLGELMATATAHPNTDGSGVAQARASVAMAIAANANTPVRLSMESTIDRVQVTPPEATVSQFVEAELAASALDASGALVLTAGVNWRWEVLDASVVLVEARGDQALAVGLDPGSTAMRVTETESGKSLVATLRVKPLRYTITEIPAPEGAIGSADARSINALGQVVGNFLAGSGSLAWPAFIWQNGQSTRLPEAPLPAVQNIPLRINGRGQIVGMAITPLTQRPILWENGQARTIDLLPGDRSGTAGDINHNGQVVGTSGVGAASFLTGPNPPRAFLWQNGETADLGTLPGYESSSAVAINDSGLIVGTVRLDKTNRNAPSRAVLWHNGQITDLGTLPGDMTSRAVDINARGQVLGVSDMDLSDEHQHVFLWENGQMRSLGDFSPARINSHGQVVGSTRFQRPGEIGPDFFAVLSGRGLSTPVQLDSLIPPDSGWRLYGANDSNDKGQIVGSGSLNGQGRSFLLTPE